MLKLLVVEDHGLVREGLLQTIRGLEVGTLVLGAAEAAEALEIMERNGDVDLVVLDLMLPNLNGMAFLSVLRKRHPDVPVVILSALDDAETVRRAMTRGASGFVPKSSSSESLLTALRRVLAGEVGPYRTSVQYSGALALLAAGDEDVAALPGLAGRIGAALDDGRASEVLARLVATSRAELPSGAP